TVLTKEITAATQSYANHRQRQCIKHRLHSHILDHQVSRNHSRPHCCSASRTTGRQSGLRLVSGRRRPSAIRPISWSAHFAGIGLDSINSCLCRRSEEHTSEL